MLAVSYLKEMLKIGAAVLGDTDDINNENQLEKKEEKEPITERAGNVSDPRQWEAEMDRDRLVGFQYM